MKSFAALALCFLLSAVPARAEIYLTVDQALDLILGKDTAHPADPRDVSEELQEKLQDEGLLSGEMKRANFYRGEKDGKVTGYALIDNEVGKHLPITYIVGISPEGKVTRVEMMVFREVRGWEARERSYLEQFEGKGQEDEMQVGKSIKNVSGATLSCKAFAKGVRRALALWQHFYGEGKSA